MQGFYLREIPNKPPPPYTPPRPIKSYPTKQILSQAIEIGIGTLWDKDTGDVFDSQILPSSFLPEMASLPDCMYRDFLWDLCLELYREAKPKPSPSCPPWEILTRRKKLAPPPRLVLISPIVFF